MTRHYVPELSGDALLWVCGFALESSQKGREEVKWLPFIAIDTARHTDPLDLQTLARLTCGFEAHLNGDCFASCPKTNIKVRASSPKEAILRCFSASQLGCWVDVPDSIFDEE